MRSQSIFAQRGAVSIVLASLACAAPAFAQDKGPAAGAGKAAPAVAAPGSAASEASDKEATRLYDDGVKEAKAGSWEKARVSMLAAFKLKPNYAWAANLGRVELKAAKPRDAAEHLSFFLREAQKIEPDDRAAVEKMLGEAKAQIGSVTIQVSAPGAQVLVDGQPVGTVPLDGPVFVEPGSRWFEVKGAGLALARKDVQVLAGSSPVVELKLTGTGQTVVAENSGQKTQPEIERAPSNKLVNVGIGLSVGLAVAGVGLGIAAAATRAEATNYLDDNVSRAACNKTVGCANGYNELQNRYSGLGTAAIYTSVAAGAVGVATAICYLADRRRPAMSQLSAGVQSHGAWISLTHNW
jgi:hypothetical protein